MSSERDGELRAQLNVHAALSSRRRVQKSVLYVCVHAHGCVCKWVIFSALPRSGSHCSESQNTSVD